MVVESAIDVLIAALCAEASEDVDRLEVGFLGVVHREQLHIGHVGKVHVVDAVELRHVALAVILDMELVQQ